MTNSAASPWVDLHVDTISQMLQKNFTSAELESELQVDVKRCKDGGVKLIVTACFTRDGQKDSAAQVQNMFSLAHRLHSDEDASFHLLREYSDFQKLLQHEVGILMSLENAACLEGQLSLLDEWHEKALRIVGICWNGENEFACGVGVKNDQGLSEHGRELVARCNELGIALDISHLGVKSCDDLFRLEPKAILATHSNARAICDHPRNLSDSQLQQLAKLDGLVGLNFYPPFLKNSEKRTGSNSSSFASVDDIALHASHIANLIGVERLAIGSDFDGIDEFPVGLQSYADRSKLSTAFIEYGFHENEIAAIFGGNFLRWWKSRS